jgi:uncharacterized protein (DUF2126 family)/transglutaminase-like putative cysteine protease
MTIQVGLYHQSHYTFDRLVGVAPHEVRLRPTAHCRTPILSYSLTVKPGGHFINWQQDPYGNYVARLVFPDKLRELSIEVDLTAEIAVINPFDFFVEDYAEKYPFEYPERLASELRLFRDVSLTQPLLNEWLKDFANEHIHPGMTNTDILVAANQRIQRDVRYIVRMEPGVYEPDESLRLGTGSCRDTAWLLVHVLRHLGFAARFVSGYLIQLKADVKSLDGPGGPDTDFTDLHAWAEAYMPGAGWIGLDPTSGLLAGEGHIPLACTATPASAAPVFGATDPCEARFEFLMQVSRIHESPRVTKPYTPEQWSAIDALGSQVEAELVDQDVRLTMGGEPTFISIEDMDGLEWNFAALGTKKRKLAEQLLSRLKARFAAGGVLHYGQGKWYPGEPLPRWALSCLWRSDGHALWRDPTLIAETEHGQSKIADAATFVCALAVRLGVRSEYVMPAYENIPEILREEQTVPLDDDPLRADLSDAKERRRLAQLLQGPLGEPVGFVLPLKPIGDPELAERRWLSCVWPLRCDHLYLLPGDSPAGWRLPLNSLPPPNVDDEIPATTDPFAPRPELGDPAQGLNEAIQAAMRSAAEIDGGVAKGPLFHTALCVQVRDGVTYVFLPPVPTAEDYTVLLYAIEQTAQETAIRVILEGYLPPEDPRLRKLAVTPDPGVIEVNIQPARSWNDIVHNTEILYEETRLTRLGTEKFMVDGRHTGTGGGNHVTVGGATPADSPLLRRPDLLRSLISYWQNHPALSYLFAGMFIGPTSQAPRVDEARDDRLYELEIAFQEMDRLQKPGEETPKPWLVDRLLRHLLVDLTGNTHRAEFSIDKLYSPDTATGRLGLLEFRAFEMPPHWQMSCVQMLLLRSLIAWFWRQPYRGRLISWGTSLHDRFMLPHFVAEDMRDVVLDLQEHGYPFSSEWLPPFFEFRFSRFGSVVYRGISLELRQALEPWHVLGDEIEAGATTRYVDSSVERLQVKLSGLAGDRYRVTCNERPLPLAPTGTHGEYVAGVRYRAWRPSSMLHPTIPVHTPLVFDLVDTWSGRSLGGCTYHVMHPGGRNYESLPVNANEAEARRRARFIPHGHTPGPMEYRTERPHPNFPLTLDLRRRPDYETPWPPAVLDDERQAQQQQQQQ